MRIQDQQTAISQWGRETFPDTPTVRIATRMNVEMAELLEAIQTGDAREAGLECADVFIMLVQVADGLGQDLAALVAEKMEINRKRSWSRMASGRVQHVETV